VIPTRSAKTRGGPRRDISLLFDVFVLNQRLRLLLSRVLAGTDMRPDEYAVYSVLFEGGPLTSTEMARQMGMPLTTVLDYLRSLLERGHVVRSPHAHDGRAIQVHLTQEGLSAFKRANVAWNAGLKQLEPALAIPVGEVRRALHALDDAAGEVLRALAQDQIGRAS
jgi:DNA-binding MarR family transcriptional regulator